MRQTGYLGISLLLVFVLAATSLPGFGQAAPAAQAKGPQAKTQAEYNAYKALYDEQNPQKKVELGEKFLTDFKESDFIANTYTMIVGAYTRAQNWAKVIDAAERAVASPVAANDNKLKAFAYANAMVAAQNMNQLDKVLAYGDKVLAIDPSDLNTMITLSAAIPAKPCEKVGICLAGSAWKRCGTQCQLAPVGTSSISASSTLAACVASSPALATPARRAHNAPSRIPAVPSVTSLGARVLLPSWQTMTMTLCLRVSTNVLMSTSP